MVSRNWTLSLGLLVTAIACGSDDAGGSGTATDSNTEAGTNTDSMTTNAEASAEESSTGPIEPGCGNGVVEPGEECDNGDANSDMEPDACRSNCEAAACRDNVVDMGEECDLGLINSDFEPDTCRYDCLEPFCGDEVTDQGELCDDGNDQFGDSCFECRFRYYFILNAPGGGNVSLLRTSRDGPPVALLADDPSVNGMIQMAIAPGGGTVYGLRTDDEVVAVNTTSGEIEMRMDIGMGAVGVDGTPMGMALASDGILYIAANAMGSTRLLSLDPSNGDAAEFVDLGAQFDVVDMTADNANGVYLSTGAGGTIEKVDVSDMALSTFGDGTDGLVNPTAISFDFDTDVLWTIDNTGGPVNVLQSDLAGTFMPFTTALESTGATTPAMMIDVGGVVTVAATEQDRVVGIALLGEVQTLFEEMVVSPVDIEKIELGM